MSDNFVPIGFDVREHPDQVQNRHGSWKVPNRGPALSTDENLWPHLWRVMKDAGRPIALPSFRGRRQNLWQSLPAMDTFLRLHDAELIKPFWQIAIGWPESVRPPRQIRGVDIVVPYSDDAFTGYTDPLEVNPDWEFLGYDVSGFWLLDGLTNCGLWSETFDGRHEVYESDLNRNILFRSPEVADQYRIDADRLVPEHSPFFVYALYKIREVA